MLSQPSCSDPDQTAAVLQELLIEAASASSPRQQAAQQVAQQAGADAGAGAGADAGTQVLVDAGAAEEWLGRSAAQLTYYGLFALVKAVKPNTLSAFFRNNHFGCLYNHEGQLYLLLTDQVGAAKLTRAARDLIKGLLYARDTDWGRLIGQGFGSHHDHVWER